MTSISQPLKSIKKGRKREWTAKVLLALVSLCFTVFGLEAAVRLLPPPYDETTGNVPLFYDQANDMFTCNRAVGWVGTPNFQGDVALSQARAHIAFNALGLHDTDHALEKAADTFRILMVGDSFVHAVQVDETETAHQALEDYLNQTASAPATRFEVMSGGVTGWGTGQQLVYYREQNRQFKPDLVLLMLFLGNDIENNLPGNGLTIGGVNCYAPYFTVCNSSLNPEPLRYAPGLNHPPENCSRLHRSFLTGMGWLYQHSHLYQQLDPLLNSYRPRQIFGTTYPHTFWALYLPNDEAALTQAWAVTEATIGQFQQEVEADGGQLAVVYFPWSILLDLLLLAPDQQAALLQEYPEFKAVEADRPNRRLTEFFTQHGIPYFDLGQPLLERQATQDVPLHFTGDNHWTVEGNRFVAEVIAEWLIN